MGSFDGLAEVYDDSRHRYPEELRDHLVDSGALHPKSRVLDLGAGTGQLTALVADVASDIVAMDPEPDMVRVGQAATAATAGVRWFTGSDRDVPDLFKPSSVDLVLIGNAFHHMEQAALLRNLARVVSGAGAVVICSSSVPVWLQDADWSLALRSTLADLMGRPVGTGGVPDHASDMQTLAESPFASITEWTFQRQQARTADSIIGELMSSASGVLGASEAQVLRSTLEPHLSSKGFVDEVVTTAALLARRMEGRSDHLAKGPFTQTG